MRVGVHILDHENFVFFLLQTSTNVLLVTEDVTIFVSTNQDHLNVNVKMDTNLEVMVKRVKVFIGFST